jgi:hypothetical protein
MYLFGVLRWQKSANYVLYGGITEEAPTTCCWPPDRCPATALAIDGFSATQRIRIFDWWRTSRANFEVFDGRLEQRKTGYEEVHKRFIGVSAGDRVTGDLGEKQEYAPSRSRGFLEVFDTRSQRDFSYSAP